jgi:hypothetical protein
MSKIYLLILINILFYLSGCARTTSSPPPAKVWGMVGISYEATKESGYSSKNSSSGSAVSTLKVEKNVGALGLGGELAGEI